MIALDRKRLGWQKLVSTSPAHAELLVVDDEPDVRQTMERLVTQFGYSVRTAASAEEADTWLASKRFDALLLDIELPRMKGVEFLGWALQRDPEMAVIMMTGEEPGGNVKAIHTGDAERCRDLCVPVGVQRERLHVVAEHAAVGERSR